MRFNPEEEADRLGITNSAPGGHPYYDCCEDIPNPHLGGSWNYWRASKPPLAPHFMLNKAATNHATDLALHGKLQHESPSDMFYPSNSSPSYRMEYHGYPHQYSGENATYGYTSGLAAHNALFKDFTVDGRGHRVNIMLGWREVGVGNHAGVYIYDAQDFASPTSTNRLVSFFD